MSKSDAARKKLDDFVPKVNQKLKKIFDEEGADLFSVGIKQRNLSRKIFNHIKEHNLRPAKRLRASFIYYGYKLLGGKKEKQIIEASTSIELVHTALLMFDDIMDRDSIRRGKPATHEFFKKYHMSNKFIGEPLHYGESMAINSGLYALCLGYKILGKSDFEEDKKIEALNRVFEGIEKTSLGQAFDVTLEAIKKFKEKDVIDLHHAKTAVYTYENPLHLGAILAGASGNDLKLLSDYAIPGGIAFQLRDDILGMFGNPEKTGKPAHSDLREGKTTLLITRALKEATKSQGEKLLKIWGNKNLTEKDAGEARRIIENTGSLAYSKEQAANWARKSQRAIPKMKKKDWKPESIEYLDGIAQYMIERDL